MDSRYKLLTLFFLFILGIRSNGQGHFNYQVGDTLLEMNSMTAFLSSNIINMSLDTVDIDMIRLVDEPSSNWVTGLCADICYNSIVDSARLRLPPNESQEFRMYFSIFGVNMDTAHAVVLFRNANNHLNNFVQDFYAIASPTLSSVKNNTETFELRITPNPMSNHVVFGFKNPNHHSYTLMLYNLHGQLVMEPIVTNDSQVLLRRSGLSSGTYIYKIYDSKLLLTTGKLIVE